tara:strand:+ start:308 stop:1681 length:1374 start_codon:yes stop_codon:yes gene_type:complete
MSKEHGHNLWPKNFQNLTSPQQVNMATQLIKQAIYLKKRPFTHSNGNAAKLAERLIKKAGDGEFCWALCFDPTMIAQLCREGFLPMAGQIFADLICLLPKLHTQRSMMLNLNTLNIDNGARQRAKQYHITIDHCINDVIKGCQIQHGKNCWFYKPLTEAYRYIQQLNKSGGLEGVRIHSFEVWDKKTNQLVAGEVGYACGGIYTSLSGYRESGSKSAGTIQCCCVAILLKKCGFRHWDLGMGMEYKTALGAKDVLRAEFLKHLKEARDMTNCILSCESKTCCNDLIKWYRNVVKEESKGEQKEDQQHVLSKKEKKRRAKKAKKELAKKNKRAEKTASTASTASTSVPVRYVTCQGEGSEMIEATFVGVGCETSVCEIGGRIEVDAKVGGGWVFCGIDLADWGGYGIGQYMKVTGGTFELLTSPNSAVWSGDECIGRFAVTHDGSSDEMVVVYGTRAD